MACHGSDSHQVAAHPGPSGRRHIDTSDASDFLHARLELPGPSANHTPRPPGPGVDYCPPDRAASVIQPIAGSPRVGDAQGARRLAYYCRLKPQAVSVDRMASRAASGCPGSAVVLLPATRPCSSRFTWAYIGSRRVAKASGGGPPTPIPPTPRQPSPGSVSFRTCSTHVK